MAKREQKQAPQHVGTMVAELKDGSTLVSGVDPALLVNAVLSDEHDADPGEAPSAATASERTRDYLQGVREGSLRVIEFVESDFGDVGRVAAGEARKRWAL
jgi:hypothetical protein